MVALIKIELFKIFRKPRTYIAFAAIAAIVILVQIALYADGEKYLGFVMQTINESFEIEGKKLNGYFVCYTILQTLLVHVPLLIALVAGDMIAGEANMGTLRLLASKPISRSGLIWSKFSASLIYTASLLLFMALLSLFGSIAIFGVSDLMVFKSNMLVILSKDDVLWRYLGAFGFAFLSMATVAALAFLLSVFADNSIGPIIATMSIVILFTILTTMDIPFFNAIKPFLFTNHMLNWKGFFENPVDRGEVMKSAVVLLAHIGVFYTMAMVIFQKKDILS
jgi:ABC-2 type transport system permease protein